MKVDLVIFDCDGVLVDSEPLSVLAMQAMMARHGCEISEEVIYDRLLGRSLLSATAIFRDDFGVDLSPADMETWRADLYRRFQEKLRPVPHIAQALRELRRPVCVASSSQPERIALSLELTGLLPWFAPHLFSATMVARGKPAPDLFLYAAAQMNTPPARCVVVEDSPAGVAAAKAAGMRVVGFCGGAHAGPAGLTRKLRALGPDALLADMRELPQTVENFG